LSKAVINSSVIIALSNAGYLQNLKDIFSETLIAKAVYEEICIAGEGLAGANELKTAVKKGIIHVKSVKDSVLIGALLDPLAIGESETIVLATEEHADVIVLDDKAARRKAKAMKLNVIGTLRILRMLYDGKVIDKIQIIEALKSLRDTGFRISDEIIRKVTEEL
jgi:uncharacterized protein